MLKVFCFASLCLFMTACSKSENKLPQECKDLPDIIEALTIKAETSPYVSADLAKKVKQFNERKLNTSKMVLAKTTGDVSKDLKLHTQYCNLNITMSQNLINKLDNVKTKAEAETVLSNIK